MKFQIKHRFSGAVLFECELDAEIAGQSYSLQLGFAVQKAVVAGANLAGANLAGANLADAYLADANLADANLADANLAGANLADANLADANLAGANLAGANLADANLAGANLAGANLADANLAGARNVPEDAGKALTPADYAQRAAEYRQRNPDVPVVEALDSKILAVIEAGEGKLDMSTWHTCETTHCRAGWAIHLAGDAGKALEGKHGPERAGGMIYRASTGRVPWFYDTDAGALADIRARAAEQVAG